MSRFLIAVWPYVGHVNASLALARVLAERGHDVAFYTGATPGSLVEREGLRRFPFVAVSRALSACAGLNTSQDEPSLYTALTSRFTSVDERNVFERRARIGALYRDMIAGTIPAQVDDLRQIVSEWHPDVIVSDALLWAPFVVLHETQAAPVAAFSFYAGCLVPGPDAPPAGLGLPSPRTWRARLQSSVVRVATRGFRSEIRSRVDAIRATYGLPPMGVDVAAWLGRIPLHMVCSSPEFDYQRRDLPPSVHYVGPCSFDRPSAQAVPAWLESLGSTRPVVYVTEGTAQVRDPILLRAAAQGLADLPVDVVVTTGSHRGPADLRLGRVSANVRLSRFVPHGDLFPKLAVVVTNGGSNTVRSALQAGVPLVVVPMEWDQLENAQRVAEAGAGVRLSMRQCRPDRLRAAVEHVLSDPSPRVHAKRIAESFARYANGGHAADLLEGLCQRRLEARGA